MQFMEVATGEIMSVRANESWRFSETNDPKIPAYWKMAESELFLHDASCLKASRAPVCFHLKNIAAFLLPWLQDLGLSWLF